MCTRGPVQPPAGVAKFSYLNKLWCAILSLQAMGVVVINSLQTPGCLTGLGFFGISG